MPPPQKRQSPSRWTGLRGDGWWPGAESNHRHADFQSAALPTELPGLKGTAIIASGTLSQEVASGHAALVAGQVDAELLELAVQVRAFQAGLLGDAGHRAAFLGQVKLEIALLEGIAGLAQRAV